jgi:hypothetical protein
MAEGMTADEWAAQGLRIHCPPEAIFCNPPPPLALKVGWQAPPFSGDIEDAKLKATQASVSTPGVQLAIVGGCGGGQVESLGQPGRGFVWTGMCYSPVAVTLRDSSNYLDLSRGAIQWIYRAANMHAVRPVLKLADGILIVGDHMDFTPTPTNPSGEFEPQMVLAKFALAPVQWYQLNPQTLAVMKHIYNPDLKKVDAIGFADLMPGGGHGDAGWINVGEIEVYGLKVPR